MFYPSGKCILGKWLNQRQENPESSKDSNQESPKAHVWSGNKAQDFNIKSIRERTVKVKLPTQFNAKDILMSMNVILLNTEVETMASRCHNN